MSAASVASGGRRQRPITDFSYLPPNERPVIVRRVKLTAQQRAAWQEGVRWLIGKLEAAAMETEKARQTQKTQARPPRLGAGRDYWAEPDPCQSGADEQAPSDAEGDECDENAPATRYSA